jgi:hypothetical protein
VISKVGRAAFAGGLGTLNFDPIARLKDDFADCFRQVSISMPDRNAMITARSMAFSSSRTLPGQS